MAIRIAILALVLSGCSGRSEPPPVEDCAAEALTLMPPPACLDQALDVDATGQVACHVLVAGPEGSDFCACDAPYLAAAGDGVTAEARAALTGDPCAPAEDTCFCALPQLEGDALEDCRTQSPVEWERRYDGLGGFCYVDPSADLGSPEVVAACYQGVPRMIRTLGPETRRAVVLCF